jgi:putative tryptophan/tyrosine transport system substrate-binding protein
MNARRALIALVAARIAATPLATLLAREFRQAATFVDRIFKGAKPGDLPIEQVKLDLVVNLKAARTIGLTIPQSLLLLADEVIE